LTDYKNPEKFWEERLTKNFDLTGVGYAALGPIYNSRLYQARINALRKAVGAVGKIFTDQNILEVGCGTGFYIEFLKQQKVVAYTGIDITEISTQSLSCQYPDFRFLKADIGDKDFSFNNQFDIILVADVLFHIVDSERFELAITNLSGLLKAGGILILSDVLTTFSIDSKQHCNWRSVQQYETILTQNNLVIKHIQSIFSVLHPPTIAFGSSFPWKVYALIWRYMLLRIAKNRWFDSSIPYLLEDIDKKIFLPHSGINTPNSKWLIAQKMD